MPDRGQHPHHLSASGPYEEIAVSAIDKVEEFGECRITQVPDTDHLRRALRREARRRKVKIETRAFDKDFVMVVALELSVLASAYAEVAMPLILETIDRRIQGIRNPTESPGASEGPALNISLRCIDAAKYLGEV